MTSFSKKFRPINFVRDRIYSLIETAVGGQLILCHPKIYVSINDSSSTVKFHSKERRKEHSFNSSLSELITRDLRVPREVHSEFAHATLYSTTKKDTSHRNEMNERLEFRGFIAKRRDENRFIISSLLLLPGLICFLFPSCNR